MMAHREEVIVNLLRAFLAASTALLAYRLLAASHYTSDYLI